MMKALHSACLLACVGLALACSRGASPRTDTDTASAPLQTLAPPRFSECPRATAGDDVPENAALSCGEGFVTRAAETLTVVIPGRDTLRLVDVNSDGEDARSFLFQGSILDRRYWIVAEQLYEGARVIVIDAASGAQTQMAARPIPSPDGSLLAAGIRGLESAESLTRLEIWRGANGQFYREFTIDPYDPSHPETSWGPGGLVWRSPDTLVVQRFLPREGEPGGEIAGDTIRVVRQGTGWRVFPKL